MIEIGEAALCGGLDVGKGERHGRGLNPAGKSARDAFVIAGAARTMPYVLRAPATTDGTIAEPDVLAGSDDDRLRDPLSSAPHDAVSTYCSHASRRHALRIGTRVDRPTWGARQTDLYEEDPSTPGRCTALLGGTASPNSSSPTFSSPLISPVGRKPSLR